MEDWRKDFFPAILQRGETYYYEGRVKELWQKEEKVCAKVAGTEEYEVQIDPTAEHGQYGFCTCPYAQSVGNCKHMAAVFFALEGGVISYEELPEVSVPPIMQKPYELPWLKAIDELPEELLRKEMMRLADQNYTLKERLSILNADGLPEGLAEEWRAVLYLITDDYADKRGYIARGRSDELAMELCDFMEEKQPLLLKLKAAEDAFLLAKMVGNAAQRRPFYDGEQAEMESVAEQCMELIQGIVPFASEALKQEMVQWYENFFDRPQTDSI